MMEEGKNKAAEMPHLRNSLYDVHKEMVQAISEQECQMQVFPPIRVCACLAIQQVGIKRPCTRGFFFSWPAFWGRWGFFFSLDAHPHSCHPKMSDFFSPRCGGLSAAVTPQELPLY